MQAFVKGKSGVSDASLLHEPQWLAAKTLEPISVAGSFIHWRHPSSLSNLHSLNVALFLLLSHLQIALISATWPSLSTVETTVPALVPMREGKHGWVVQENIGWYIYVAIPKLWLSRQRVIELDMQSTVHTPSTNKVNRWTLMYSAKFLTFAKMEIYGITQRNACDLVCYMT